MEIKITGAPEDLAAFVLKALDGKAPHGDDNKFKEMVNQFRTMYDIFPKSTERSEREMEW